MNLSWLIARVAPEMARRCGIGECSPLGLKILDRVLRKPTRDAAMLSYLMNSSANAEKPSARLWDLIGAALPLARAVTFPELDRRADTKGMISRPWNTWPGEHYKLLKAFVAVLKPRVIVEIGTHEGWSALAMRDALPDGSRIITFDVLPYYAFPNPLLEEKDFQEGRITQILANLADPHEARKHREILEAAEFIFVDAGKDGSTERRLLERFTEIGLKKNPIIIFDDVRVPLMLAIWAEIDRPKIDLVSFGHWSGTGLVDWTDRYGD